MANWGKYYIAVLTAIYFAGMLGYETLALLNGQPGDTISEIVWAFLKGRPYVGAGMCITLLLAFGLLMGHFFWQRRS